MDCTTTTQLVTVGVLAFFMGGLVSFFCAVFVMAQRLPPREPPLPLDPFPMTDFPDKRKRLHRIGVPRSTVKH